jgi:hypothetical protein
MRISEALHLAVQEPPLAEFLANPVCREIFARGDI